MNMTISELMAMRVNAIEKSGEISAEIRALKLSLQKCTTNSAADCITRNINRAIANLHRASKSLSEINAEIKRKNIEAAMCQSKNYKKLHAVAP